jgi:hypothetical protein
VIYANQIEPNKLTANVNVTLDTMRTTWPNVVSVISHVKHVLVLINPAVNIVGIIEQQLVLLNVLVMLASMKKMYLSVVSVIYLAKHVQKMMKKVVPNVRRIEQVVIRTHANVL